MNWHFNQNCELVIDDIPTIGTTEVLVKDGDIWATAVDREIPLTVKVDDGLYEYYQFPNTNKPEIKVEELEDPIEKIFSICNLRKCTFTHEKQAISEFLSTCTKRNCNKKSSQQSTRDILLISLFVLEHLICEEKYSEAKRIVEQLGSCGNLCNTQTLKSCCCNG